MALLKRIKLIRGRDLYILACFIGNNDGSTRVEWSLYHDDDDDMSEDEEPLVEMVSTSQEFYDMLDAEDWKQVGEELVIVK
jgi:hypothetical protein